MDNIILLGTRYKNKASWSRNGIAEYSGEKYANIYKQVCDVANKSIDKIGYIYGIGYYVMEIKNENFYFIKITNAELDEDKNRVYFTYESLEDSGHKSEMLYTFNGIGDNVIISDCERKNFENWLKNYKIEINSEWIRERKSVEDKKHCLKDKAKAFIVQEDDEIGVTSVGDKLERKIGEKPRVFIGSSVESINIAEFIQENLMYSCYCEMWSQGTFKPNSTALESLMKALDTFDFAIFVFSPDDVMKIRNNTHSTVRDNVFFETGLFIGRIGKERVFYIAPNDKEIHLPTDLSGFNPEKYDTSHPNIKAAVGVTCLPIKREIEKMGKFTR